MIFLLDTSAAVALRDGDPDVRKRLEALDGPICLSLLTRIALEGGVDRSDPVRRVLRRARLDQILTAFETLPLDVTVVERYRTIVESAGYSRRKVVDRVIAAHALDLDATLVTLNGDDVKDIAGLQVLAW
ncbi:PIN domain-containing protein [Phenylobacterium sp.]|uniref:PIN domain-containing protein n=1 Tax=Phenylobacterium sp. TaxID=1871053 RepID=UPI0025FFA5F7|nr:PIN domain-containing protein [Phenylobacterium sp.]